MFSNEKRFSGIDNVLLRQLWYFAADLSIYEIDIRANIYFVRDLANEVILGRNVISNL